MNTRSRVALIGILVAASAPATANAECFPVSQGELAETVLSDGEATVDAPVASPAVLLSDSRDPANSMINRLGLVELQTE